jgi:2-oxoglutarate ferredoxin oxidoreductase subunit delta
VLVAPCPEVPKSGRIPVDAVLAAIVRAARPAASRRTSTPDARIPPNGSRIRAIRHIRSRVVAATVRREVTMAIAGSLRADIPGNDLFEPLDIATDRCKGCALCVDVCPRHVLALDASRINALGHHPVRLLDAAACTSCALCARICPDVVFTVFARPRSA